MTKAKKATDEPQLPEGGDDVEGHNLWVNPSASREMTQSRSREIEREARERQRAKEAKGR
jgi:redox-sensitive bicupin YhaK (pirin superfamily)